jgi:uncharacterized OsmC-like protein
MTGTFGGALEARGIPAGDGYLSSQSVGELEKDNGTLVIKRVKVKYTLNVAADLLAEKRDAIDRAFKVHPGSCPVYKTVQTSIDISKELEIVET